MNRTAFRELLIRYINGTTTSEEKALVDHWYELLYDNNLPAFHQEELDNIEQEMWAHIEKEGDIHADNTKILPIKCAVRRKRLYYFTAAAIITGLAISVWTFFFSDRKSVV
jgi:transmembrane sensor